jgi:hypothetical protein
LYDMNDRTIDPNDPVALLGAEEGGGEGADLERADHGYDDGTASRLGAGEETHRDDEDESGNGHTVEVASAKLKPRDNTARITIGSLLLIVSVAVGFVVLHKQKATPASPQAQYQLADEAELGASAPLDAANADDSISGQPERRTPQSGPESSASSSLPAMAAIATSVASQVPPLPSSRANVGLQTSPSVSAPITPSTISGGQGGAASYPSAATGAAPLSSAQMQRVEGTLQSLSTKVDSLAARMDAVDAAAATRTATKKEPHRVALAGAAPVTSIESAAEPTAALHGHARRSAGGKAGRKAEGTVAAGAAVLAASAPAEGASVVQRAAAAARSDGVLAGLRLRGVYPPRGTDRRAWILDGDHLVVVVAGDRIRGSRVLSVEPDVVRTDAGVIR